MCVRACVANQATAADKEGQAQRRMKEVVTRRRLLELARAQTDEVRALIATADGSEVHTHDLETQVERAQCAESAMLALEEMREIAAALYLNEFGSSWKPVSSSRFRTSL